LTDRALHLREHIVGGSCTVIGICVASKQRAALYEATRFSTLTPVWQQVRFLRTYMIGSDLGESSLQHPAALRRSCHEP
jgi:hypothetical protein